MHPDEQRRAERWIIFPAAVIGFIYALAVTSGSYSPDPIFGNAFRGLAQGAALMAALVAAGGGAVLGFLTVLIISQLLKHSNIPLYRNEKRFALAISLVWSLIGAPLMVFIGGGAILFNGSFEYNGFRRLVEDVMRAVNFVLPHLIFVAIVMTILVWIYFDGIEALDVDL